MLCGYHTEAETKWPAICKTTLNVFSCMKIIVFWFKLRWDMLSDVPITIRHRWVIWWLGAEKATNHYLTKDDLIHWHISRPSCLRETIYRQSSNISRTKHPNCKCFSYRLAVVSVQSIEAGCLVGNKDVVGAAPTGSTVQYIPRNMHTVFALLCFDVVIHWLIFPYPSGLYFTGTVAI